MGLGWVCGAKGWDPSDPALDPCSTISQGLGTSCRGEPPGTPVWPSPRGHTEGQASWIWRHPAFPGERKGSPGLKKSASWPQKAWLSGKEAHVAVEDLLPLPQVLPLSPQLSFCPHPSFPAEALQLFTYPTHSSDFQCLYVFPKQSRLGVTRLLSGSLNAVGFWRGEPTKHTLCPMV